MNHGSRLASLQLRWLGVAGIELSFAGKVLLVDPYFTRISPWQQFFGRIQPDLELGQRHAPRADTILVTHAHNDHLLDVPAIAMRTGAVVYGSANTLELCRILGLPEEQRQLIPPDEKVSLGPFLVKAVLSEHMRVPIFTPGSLRPGLQPPLRAIDFRMDTNYSYQIEVDGLHLMTDPGSHPAALPALDGLFIFPFRKRGYYHALLRNRSVRWIIPTHWDDFWRPLSKPILPTRTPPNMAWPPFKRFNLLAWKQEMERLLPGVRVLLPEIIEPFSLE